MFKKRKKSYLLLSIMFFSFALIVAIFFYSYIPKIQKPSTQSELSNIFEYGDQKKGIELLEDYLRNNPNDTEAKNKLAMMYYMAHDYEKLINYMENNNLQSATVLNMLADVYKNKNDFNKANEYYAQAIDINPKNSQLYISYSSFLQSQGKLTDALKIIESGINSGMNSVALFISAASVSHKMGDRDKAILYSNQTLSIEPENLQAKAILKNYQ